MHATYALKRQSGKWGHYAVLTLRGCSCSAAEACIRFQAELPSSAQTAIRFGIEYGFEHLGRGSEPLIIDVEDVRTNPVDTSLICLAFAAAHALWQMLGESPPRLPELIAEIGEFRFPK